MKRKLIFGIVLAMILAPMSVFAADITLKADAGTTGKDGTVTVEGTGFAKGEYVSILGGSKAKPTLADPTSIDYVNQVLADENGKFSLVIPVAAYMYGGDEYYVQAASASTAAGGPIVKNLADSGEKIVGTFAEINAPIRFNTKLKTSKVLPATVNSKDYVITQNNNNVSLVAVPDAEGRLAGINVTGLKAGTTVVTIQTTDGGNAIAAIVVNVAT